MTVTILPAEAKASSDDPIIKATIHDPAGVRMVLEIGKRRLTFTEQSANGLPGILGVQIAHLNNDGSVAFEEEPGII